MTAAEPPKSAVFEQIRHRPHDRAECGREHRVEPPQRGRLEAKKPAIGGGHEEEAVDRPAECPNGIDFIAGGILDLARGQPVGGFGRQAEFSRTCWSTPPRLSPSVPGSETVFGLLQSPSAR
jgi:hypothetical protein